MSNNDGITGSKVQPRYTPPRIDGVFTDLAADEIWKMRDASAAAAQTDIHAIRNRLYESMPLIKQLTFLREGGTALTRWAASLERKGLISSLAADISPKSDLNARRGAIRLAAPVLHEDAVWEAIVGNLEDDDPSIRVEAIVLIGSFKTPKAIPYLVQALKDLDPWVREAAVEGFGDRRANGWTNRIIELFRDSDEKVRTAAAEIFHWEEDAQTVSMLKTLLFDGQADLQSRCLAARALKGTKDQETLHFMRGILMDKQAPYPLRYGALLGLSADPHIETARALLKTLVNEPFFTNWFINDERRSEHALKKAICALIQLWITKGRQEKHLTAFLNLGEFIKSEALRSIKNTEILRSLSGPVPYFPHLPEGMDGRLSPPAREQGTGRAFVRPLDTVSQDQASVNCDFDDLRKGVEGLFDLEALAVRYSDGLAAFKSPRNSFILAVGALNLVGEYLQANQYPGEEEGPPRAFGTWSAFEILMRNGVSRQALQNLGNAWTPALDLDTPETVFVLNDALSKGPEIVSKDGFDLLMDGTKRFLNIAYGLDVLEDKRLGEGKAEEAVFTVVDNVNLKRRTQARVILKKRNPSRLILEREGAGQRVLTRHLGRHLIMAQALDATAVSPLLTANLGALR